MTRALTPHQEDKFYYVYSGTLQLAGSTSPINNGWEIINGKCRPVRYTVPPLPLQLNQGIRPDGICESSCDGDGDSSDSDNSTDTFE